MSQDADPTREQHADSEEEDNFNPQPELGSDDEIPEPQPKDDDNNESASQRSRKPSEARKSPSRHRDRNDVTDRPRPNSNSREASRGSPDHHADVKDDDVEDEAPRNSRPGEAGADEENNAGDEDEDEDGEDDEDEDEVLGHRQKRRKRDRRTQFIDFEAEVDEDEDEDDEDEDLPEGFVADDHPDDEALAPGEASDDRRHRELDRRRMEQENLTAEQIAARMSERYADYGKSRGAPIDSVVVPQRLLLPSVDDPTIWGVRCRPGKEREIVFAITKRIEQRFDTPTPLRITSAFERGGTMAGYIYVEARTKADVKTAVDGIINVFVSREMVLVPIQEMPDLLRTQKSKTIDPGMWVRIKRGKYQGDLAYVEEVQENGLEVELKIVPREDYGANEDANASMLAGIATGAAAKRKRLGAFGKNLISSRPPPRLFNENEARKRHGRYLQQIDSLSSKKFQYQGNIYSGGYLIKMFKVQMLQTEDVNPTLEEVSKFTTGQDEGADTLDLQKLAATLKQTTADSYLPGDAVEIYSGEQRGVIGKAVSIRGEIVTLKVTDGDLKGQSVEAPVKDLRKRFREGDHVKVIGGSKFIDEVGMVVRIKDHRVTLLSDSNNAEITVFSKDLRAATDSSATQTGGKYDLHDLVQLDPATVGMVVKVDRESLRVLTQAGEVRTLLPSSIAGKLERRRYAVSTDKDGTEIRNDDTVKEVGGDQRQGRVIHIHRSFLFVQNRQQTENSGIFVARSSGVISVAAHTGRAANSGPDLTKMNPSVQRNGANNSAMMPPPKSFGRDRMIGKTCTIRKGPYKGLIGIVKDASDTEARVELHTKNKIITISKDILSIKDPITGQTLETSRFGGSGGAGRGHPQTAYGGNNPFGGATPGPTWGDGGRTPAISGGKTPAWGSASGGRTPGWKVSTAAGGRTPAPGWSDGSRTSYGGGDGSRTAYGGATAYGGPTWNPNPSGNLGSRTPAWSSGAAPGGRTPAPNSGYADAATPFASAPTPGAEYHYSDRPTPRGANPYGATPGAYGAAQTPGNVGGDEEGYE